MPVVLFWHVTPERITCRTVTVKVDWTGFEPMTPRVQGGYTTSLYYQPTQDTIRAWILIVVLGTRVLFAKKCRRLWYY